MQRGHNRERVFFEDQDYLEYLKIVKRVADACHCAIHAYALMTNHIHLLLTPGSAGSSKELTRRPLKRQCERRRRVVVIVQPARKRERAHTIGRSTEPTLIYASDRLRQAFPKKKMDCT